MKANPLLDNIFLEKLFTAYDREIYAKITALNFDEFPTEEISGKVTGGSINVDGTSACRRTCSLTLVANEVNINDYYWGLNTKFELQIGLTNRIDEKYPDIIWFKEGIYLITTFSTALGTSNYTINIQGKDKMGLLDGTIGGTLTALSYDFGREDYTDENGVSHRRKLPIRDIVTELIHEYAHEPWENIIVQDLDDFGVELLQYRGTATNPLYLFFNINSQEVEQMTLDGSFTVYKGRQISCTISNIENIVFEVNDKGEEIKGKYYNLNELYTVSNPTAFKLNRNDKEENYYIIKITTGQTCGYRMTDITYAGDLIANIGETVVSVLDKICKMLGDFEYYYDTDGKFIFKRKNQYIYKSFNHHTTTESSQSYIENSAYISPTIWDFTGSTLITSFNNTPNLSELKNDYSLWGTRKSLAGNDLPIHLRYAIDKKPTYYKTLRGDAYGTTTFINQMRDQITKEAYKEETINQRIEEKLKDIIIVDWREIIYQMAIDYRRFNHCDDFGLKVQEVNGKQLDGKYIYPRGVTGYEQYYVDMEGFWRQIYCPQYDYTTITLSENQYINAKPGEYFVKYWNTDDENCYEARYLYKDITTADLTYNDISNGVLHTVSSPYNLTTTYYYKPDPNKWINGWNPIVDNSPESLNFWFDFLDDGGDIERYGTSFVGDRPKAVNDSMIKSIYFRETPTLIFTDNIAKIDKKLGYSYLQYSPAMASLFTMSAQGKDAIDVLYEHLYKNSYCIESVTVNALPIYHLEPNNMINILDTRAGINGTYVMTKFTLPLTYNGTMSITATKAVEEIF